MQVDPSAGFTATGFEVVNAAARDDGEIALSLK